jgi:hypothetical protein
VRELAELISRAPVVAIHCTVDLQGFAETFGDLPNHLRHPYVFAHEILIIAAWHELMSRGQSERFEIIFDENLVFAPRVKALYIPLLRVAPEEIRKILPVDPLFRDDKEFVPLQAADMLAWLLRRTAASERHAMDWVHEILNPAVRVSPHSQILSREVIWTWAILAAAEARGIQV